jgi:hypothetical protein
VTIVVPIVLEEVVILHPQVLIILHLTTLLRVLMAEVALRMAEVMETRIYVYFYCHHIEYTVMVLCKTYIFFVRKEDSDYEYVLISDFRYEN